MADHVMPIRPGEFCRQALKALEGAEGQRKRRKRDQKPDQIGLAIKSDLLTRATEEDPEPEDFEAWLIAQVIAVPAGGPVRAMALQVLEEYRFATLDVSLAHWLRAGAPTDDAMPRPPANDAHMHECSCAAYSHMRDI